MKLKSVKSKVSVWPHARHGVRMHVANDGAWLIVWNNVRKPVNRLVGPVHEHVWMQVTNQL